MKNQTRLFAVIFGLSFTGLLSAQENPPPAAAPEAAESQPAPAAKPSTTDQLKDSAEKFATQTEEEAKKLARSIDQNPNARTAAAGILQPIYVVAETLAFPAFHWLAFALMSAGVISFALQLVLGKLVVLMRMGFSLKEIISDAVGLAISIFGLVLTTQAAAENSTFTQSAAAVISATAVGVIFGFILYLWGQAQEVQAAVGRTVAVPKSK